MPVIDIREWNPDAAALRAPGAPRVENAVPGVNGYKPHPSLSTVTGALNARPLGAVEAKDNSGSVFQYAGDVDTLYVLSGTTWGDVSVAGGYATGSDEAWEFVRWRNQVLATNFSNSPQEISMGGANFANLTTALRFRHIAVVRDFVVAGNTWDATDGEIRDRVRWSAFNDPTDWTVDPSTQSDFRDLKVGGAVQRVIGGEYGVIVSEQSTFRMTYAGSPVVFEINEVIPGVGALAPGAVVRLGEFVFIASEHGFFALRGGSSAQQIGEGRVDRFFRNDLDEDNAHRMSAVADPKSGRVYWAYPGSGNNEGRPNKIIVFDTGLNKWGLLDQEVELIWRSGGIATTLEGLDAFSSSIDDLDVSLDDSQWKGGAPQLSAFQSDFTNGNFGGSPMQGLVELRETEFAPGRRTSLTSLRSLVDGGTTTVRVGTRNKQSESVEWGPSLTELDSGRFTTRSNARYHRFELTLTGEWSDVIGVQLDDFDIRRGMRRG